MVSFKWYALMKDQRRNQSYSINLVSLSFRSISNRAVHDELNARTNCFDANTRPRHSVIYPKGEREREIEWKKCSESKWRMLFIGDEGDECVPTSQRSCSNVWNDDDAQWNEIDRFSASFFPSVSSGKLSSSSLFQTIQKRNFLVELRNRKRRLLKFHYDT